ncbi:hypothetical protein C4D60_Mb01t29760 [Musa balbisiana]|uniref:Uncharacterized protein n=1 Tax=Musa balbisiana TaxID=52838 RepID=A0A4S8JRP8_MUSBA|nr:hypothetical protein C4D60_Mb01t29760 [Musa balbisiana]
MDSGEGVRENGYQSRKWQQARKLPLRHGEVVTINNNTGLFESGNWNEYNLNPLTRIHWRASLVPAAALEFGRVGRSLAVCGHMVYPSLLVGDALPGLRPGGSARCYFEDIRTNHAKAFAKDVFINQERKLGARRRSDTVLVSTINDADQGSADVALRTPPAPYEKSKSLGSGGSMVARLKLKGIDGRAPPGVEPAA